MPGTNLVSLVVAGSLMVSSGCALRPQIKYDPRQMPALTDNAGRALEPGEALTKAGITRLLGDLPQRDLDPELFHPDTNAVGKIFAPVNGGRFSIVIVPDIQIHDRSVGFGPSLTYFLDKHIKIETTVRGFIQDHADVFYLGFVLKAIRLGLELNTNIDLVVGLGDATHVGRQPELAAFNEMVGKFLLAGSAEGWQGCWSGTWLQTPFTLSDGRLVWWCNLLGNHDVQFQGNFTRNFPTRIPGDGIISGPGLRGALEKAPPFNTACRTNCDDVLGQGTAASGYYTVDRPLPDGRKVRLVMINTSERVLCDPIIERGAFYPSVSAEQFEWLRNTLQEAQTNASIGLVLVFGHYPLFQVTVNRTGKRSDRDGSYGEVPNLLGGVTKVKAYFSGHLHPGSPPVEHRFTNHVIMEYISPSLQEFPKCFGLASVGKDPVSGEYTTRVKYYNLEDLMGGPISVRWFEVGEEAGRENQQARFCAWLARLSERTSNREQRIQMLAKCCYLSAVFDLREDLRTRIDTCFNRKHARQLLQEYHKAQELWEQMKRDQSWQQVQRLLNGEPPATAPLITGCRSAKNGQ